MKVYAECKQIIQEVVLALSELEARDLRELLQNAVDSSYTTCNQDDLVITLKEKLDTIL